MADPILIIGAGAAGLMAAYELSRAGFPVTLVEAAGHAGGRMLTLHDKGFTTPVEAGAEFVHGSLPITLELLKAGNLSYRPVKGKMIRVRKGEWIKEDLFSGEDWQQLMEKMEQLEKDMPIEKFLETYFSDARYELLRSSVRGFAEGYDLVDTHRASTKALHREWQEEGEQEFRVDGGYVRLVNYLIEQCIAHGAAIHLRMPVQEVRWKKDRVELHCAGGNTFIGHRLITTVPLGILQLYPGEPGALQFSPDLPQYREAALDMGYGSIIKVLMEFRTPFWEKKQKDIGFILSDEAVPTWWTQFPAKDNLLTAWIAATAMRNFQALDEAGRLAACLQSLAAIFHEELSFVKEQLTAYSIHDWMTAPFIHGGYSYETVDSEEARQQMHQTIEGTLFFAGEALYEGPALATVEAAFSSGRHIAQKIIAQS